MPRTIASVILFPEDIRHRRDMVGLWGSCTDRIFIKPPEDWAGEIKGYKGRRRHSSIHYPCPYIWTQFLITWDGIAALCCRDFCNVRTAIGDVNHEDIHEIWHGERLRMLRELDARRRERGPCQCCGYMPNWWGER